MAMLTGTLALAWIWQPCKAKFPDAYPVSSACCSTFLLAGFCMFGMPADKLHDGWINYIRCFIHWTMSDTCMPMK